MDPIMIYPVGSSESCCFASRHLEIAGISLTDHPSPEVTHLLLDVPSFNYLQDCSSLIELLRMLPKSLTIIGGNLAVDDWSAYQTMDLLQDPFYLAKNASITAECALQAAAPHLKTTFADSPTLILGWGRIGKCLAKLLSSLGCPLSVAARKIQDRAMLEALGYSAVDFSQIKQTLRQYKVIFNTVPNLSLHSEILNTWKGGIAIDLASYPGMQGDCVIPARGLPGKYAPDTSGKLIAETILRLNKEAKL